MRQSKRPLLMGLLIAITVLATGCSRSPEEAGGQSVVPVSIDCRVFYRPSASESLSESAITLTTNADHEVIAFADMEFNAEYSDDEFEGRSLLISVTSQDTGDEIVRHLYQMDRGKSLSNQFIGGHGFTGLIYVYHPSSTAELQCFCEAR
ncbi:hypothetical protein ACFLS0_00080 [Candidatus Bipolaricaulota bacterium]